MPLHARHNLVLAVVYVAERLVLLEMDVARAAYGGHLGAEQQPVVLKRVEYRILLQHRLDAISGAIFTLKETRSIVNF